MKIFAEIEKQRLKGSKVYLAGTIIGILVGSVFCLSGLVIIILGINGSIEWIFEAKNITSKLSNASPGALFAVLGMLILWKYKPRVSNRFTVHPVTLGHSEYSNPKSFVYSCFDSAQHDRHSERSRRVTTSTTDLGLLYLLNALQTKGIPIEQAFKQILRGVEKETNGQQIPWIASSLREDFSFNP